MSIRGFSYKMKLEDLIFLDENKDTKFLVFIYNELKSNSHKNEIFDNGGCSLLEEVITKHYYTMYDMGGFPLISDLVEGCGKIKGELYEVDATTLLVLNDIHHLCDKREIELEDGRTCISYVASIRLNNKIVEPDEENIISWKI